MRGDGTNGSVTVTRLGLIDSFFFYCRTAVLGQRRRRRRRGRRGAEVVQVLQLVQVGRQFGRVGRAVAERQRQVRPQRQVRQQAQTAPPRRNQKNRYLISKYRYSMKRNTGRSVEHDVFDFALVRIVLWFREADISTISTISMQFGSWSLNLWNDLIGIGPWVIQNSVNQITLGWIHQRPYRALPIWLEKNENPIIPKITQIDYSLFLSSFNLFYLVILDATEFHLFSNSINQAYLLKNCFNQIVSTLFRFSLKYWWNEQKASFFKCYTFFVV